MRLFADEHLRIVISPAGDLTVKNLRLHGTLVVLLAAGKSVILDNEMLMEPFRANYPVLIVSGDMQVKINATNPLSESALSLNFNPAGSPYQGAADADTTDVYPCLIKGLVHVTGAIAATSGSPLVNGVMISGSAAATDAVDINASVVQIVYDPSIYASPPMGYTENNRMVVVPGSYKQVILP